MPYLQYTAKRDDGDLVDGLSEEEDDDMSDVDQGLSTTQLARDAATSAGLNKTVKRKEPAVSYQSSKRSKGK